jgi:hypothetical protein
MPLIRVRTTLAAGGTAYPLQGSQYEFLPFDAFVEFAILALAAADVVNATVFSGSDVLMQGSQIDYKLAAGVIVYPEDYNLSDVAAAGERLSIELTELAAGTPSVRTSVRITPL